MSSQSSFTAGSPSSSRLSRKFTTRSWQSATPHCFARKSLTSLVVSCITLCPSPSSQLTPTWVTRSPLARWLSLQSSWTVSEAESTTYAAFTTTTTRPWSRWRSFGSSTAPPRARQASSTEQALTLRASTLSPSKETSPGVSLPNLTAATRIRSRRSSRKRTTRRRPRI